MLLKKCVLDGAHPTNPTHHLPKSSRQRAVHACPRPKLATGPLLPNQGASGVFPLRSL